MIADIDFRIVKRKTGKALVGRLPTGSLNLVDNEESVLQFRKFDISKGFEEEIDGSFRLIDNDAWTPWQDVPVVEECGP